jgi:hypothetical protein
MKICLEVFKYGYICIISYFIETGQLFHEWLSHIGVVTIWGDQMYSAWGAIMVFCLFVCFCGTGAWTQGQHLEPLHQPFFVMDFFQDGVSQTICLGRLRTMILPISATQLARIIGVSHHRPAHHVLIILDNLIIFII